MQILWKSGLGRTRPAFPCFSTLRVNFTGDAGEARRMAAANAAAAEGDKPSPSSLLGSGRDTWWRENWVLGVGKGIEFLGLKANEG